MEKQIKKSRAVGAGYFCYQLNPPLWFTRNLFPSMFVWIGEYGPGFAQSPTCLLPALILSSAAAAAMQTIAYTAPYSR